jgi:hypothetical protein
VHAVHKWCVSEFPVELKPKIKMPRGAVWSEVEDITLTCAFLHISSDPIVSDIQQSDTFWMRVQKLFFEFMGPKKQSRTLPAVKTQWTKINHDINKFIGLLSKIESQNPSGENEAGMVARAKQLYFKVEGKTFTFESSWMILKRFVSFYLYGRLVSHFSFQSPKMGWCHDD